MRAEGLLNSLYDLGVSQKVKKYIVLLGAVICVKYRCNLEACGEKGISMEESELNHLEPSKDH